MTEFQALVEALGDDLASIAMQDLPEALAAELAESFINGNGTHVRDELRALPVDRAVATTAILVASLEDDDRRRLTCLLATF